MLELWGNIGFLVFTLSTFMFTVLYLTSSRWYKSFAASIIALFAVGVTFLCSYLALRIWDIYLPGVEWIRLVIFWTFGVAMLSAIIGFLEVQFGRRGSKLRARLAQRYVDVKDRNVTER